MKEDGWQEWETNYKGGDKKKWRQGKVRKQLEGEPREAAEGQAKALQEGRPKGRSLPERNRPGGDKLLMPEKAIQNF
ncbi:MAG: hypothetical protein RE472_03040 [Thermoplasmatales archaeon]|nr:MAG: hypothetical protein RE472_09890 [Thermoplasmatales archaeon]WMT49954.1 MAG: hypothetical protein RE472_03040 [Thermoplasmatales archaeon]